MADHAVPVRPPEPAPVDLDALLAQPRADKVLAPAALRCLDCGRPLARHTNPNGSAYRKSGPFGPLWTCAEMDEFDRNAERRDARDRYRPVALLRQAWTWAVSR